VKRSYRCRAFRLRHSQPPDGSPQESPRGRRFHFQRGFTRKKIFKNRDPDGGGKPAFSIEKVKDKRFLDAGFRGARAGGGTVTALYVRRGAYGPGYNFPSFHNHSSNIIEGFCILPQIGMSRQEMEIQSS
jgi:hypothetical protein